MCALLFKHSSDPHEQESVLSWLRDFNMESNPQFMLSLESGAQEEFFVVAQDESGTVIGGLRGVSLHKWLKIDVMAVSPDHRRQGVGRELVNEAEQMARGRGCEYSYVDTMSFQAPEFYLALGYEESGRLKDWDSHGHDKMFLTKRLNSRE